MNRNDLLKKTKSISTAKLRGSEQDHRLSTGIAAISLHLRPLRHLFISGFILTVSAGFGVPDDHWAKLRETEFSNTDPQLVERTPVKDPAEAGAESLPMNTRTNVLISLTGNVRGVPERAVRILAQKLESARPAAPMVDLINQLSRKIHHYEELLDQLSVPVSENPDIDRMRVLTQIALEEGDIAEAERLLKEANERTAQMKLKTLDERFVGQ